MDQIKKLNLKSLENRISKTTATKDALRSVTPFTVSPPSQSTKIIVKKDNKNV